MALDRRAAVFRRKVLEKLFPAPTPDVTISSTEDSTVLQSPVSEQEGCTESSEGYPSSPGKKGRTQPPRKMYTVPLPPEDYIPDANNEVNYTNAESNDDSDSDASVLSSRLHAPHIPVQERR